MACLTRLLPFSQIAAVALGLCTWTVLCGFLVFNDTLALAVKIVMLFTTVLGSMLLPLVLPALLARRAPRSFATWGCAVFAVAMLVGTAPLLVGNWQWGGAWDGNFGQRQAWVMPAGHDAGFAAAIWLSMLVMCCIHSTLVFVRNFEDGALVRIYLMVLSLFYIPVSSTTFSMLEPIIQEGETSGSAYVGGLIFLFIFPIGIPLLQFYTLRSIQTKMVTEIVTWPGKEGGADQRDEAARARVGVLFLRFEIRLPDAAIPRLYGASGLIRWHSLAAGCNSITLPFYWTVVETIRKLAVVALCSLMNQQELGHARCAILILIFGVWQLLVSRVRPYAANPLIALSNGAMPLSGATQRTWLYRVGSLDVNEIVIAGRSNMRNPLPVV